jgi:hypothetical protein
MTQPYAQPTPGGYADVPIPSIPGQSVGYIPAAPPMPGAYPSHPSLQNINQPPLPPGGPLGVRGEFPNHADQESGIEKGMSLGLLGPPQFGSYEL